MHRGVCHVRPGRPCGMVGRLAASLIGLSRGLRLGRRDLGVPDRGRASARTAAARRSGTCSAAARARYSTPRTATSPPTTTTATRDDVALMRELGPAARTASRSRWPRVVPDGVGRGQRRAASTSTTGWSTSCWPPASRPWVDPLPLGPAAGPGGAGRLARPRHRRRASWSTPLHVHERLGDRVAMLADAQRAVVRGLPRLRHGRARAGGVRPGRRAGRRAPPAAGPRAGRAALRAAGGEHARQPPSTSCRCGRPARTSADVDARPAHRRAAEPPVPGHAARAARSREDVAGRRRADHRPRPRAARRPGADRRADRRARRQLLLHVGRGRRRRAGRAADGVGRLAARPLRRAAAADDRHGLVRGAAGPAGDAAPGARARARPAARGHGVRGRLPACDRRRRPPRVPRRAPARGAPGDRRGRRRARLHGLVAARQLRVGLGLRQALRRRGRRLRHAAAHAPGQRALVRRAWRGPTRSPPPSGRACRSPARRRGRAGRPGSRGGGSRGRRRDPSPAAASRGRCRTTPARPRSARRARGRGRFPARRRRGRRAPGSRW